VSFVEDMVDSQHVGACFPGRGWSTVAPLPACAASWQVSLAFNARKPWPDSRNCFLWPFAVCSPILILMSFGIQRRKLFVVECKRCRRDVPAGVAEFPFQSIVVVCPLCGEQRRYLPSEVALGTPHHLVAKQARAGQR
jgi:hypothetical protein